MGKKLFKSTVMIKISLFIMAIISLFIMNNCQYFEQLSYKEWQKSSGANDGVDVYIGGNYNDGTYDHPCYWKNGEVVDFGSYSNSAVLSISLDGDDIYCGGYYSSPYNACYWKNGAQVNVELDYPAGNSQIISIAVVNGVLFACGFEQISGNAEACYWINGKKYPLNNPGTNGSYAQSIVVDKDTLDFYIAGYYKVSATIRYACYWKNGGECVTLPIPTPTTTTYNANAITVSNGRVYASGSYTDGDQIPCYWVDGKYIELPHTAGTNATVLAISLYYGDVYCAGKYDTASALWKDNSIVWTDGTSVDANGVTVYDNDTYVAGCSTPYWWKNGSLSTLSHPGTSGVTTCIAVRAKR